MTTVALKLIINLLQFVICSLLTERATEINGHL